MTPQGGRLARWFARAAISICSIAVTLSLVVLAAGTAAGRWRLWPVVRSGSSTAIGSDAAVFLVPVPTAQVHGGDRVVMRRDDHKPALYRVRSVLDSSTGRAEVLDEHGHAQEVTLPGKVWRVSRDVPYAGLVLRLLAGPVQSLALVAGGIVVIARAESRRHRGEGEARTAPRPRGRWLRRLVSSA
jgi:hypothetical protein